MHASGSWGIMVAASSGVSFTYFAFSTLGFNTGMMLISEFIFVESEDVACACPVGWQIVLPFLLTRWGMTLPMQDRGLGSCQGEHTFDGAFELDGACSKGPLTRSADYCIRWDVPDVPHEQGVS